jgi:outer membrane protein TolC
LKRALRLARRKMNIIKSQYEQGMSSATDFNTANLDLTEARLNVQRWRLRLALKLNELEFISGKPISAWSI